MLSSDIKNKIMMPTLTTSIQHYTGGSSHGNYTHTQIKLKASRLGKKK